MIFEIGTEQCLVFLNLSQYKIDLYGNVFNIKTGHLLKPFIDKYRYHRYSLWNDFGIRNLYMSHRLVALSFIVNPHNYPQVNHIDGNKSNNHYLNLEWVDNLMNAHHALTHGLMPHAKIDEQTCHQICKMLENRLSQSEISRILNVPRTTISTIWLKRNWKHISSQYNF